ncbi:hypothetical protein VNO77_00390 [Canavalia gladiata]|uniref:ABC transporter domain-containing protein n=1 Tax=Canavalia gladiata TaxID=3824 RepID=A0AAN9MUK9_CANGL
MVWNPSPFGQLKVNIDVGQVGPDGIGFGLNIWDYEGVMQYTSSTAMALSLSMHCSPTTYTLRFRLSPKSTFSTLRRTCVACAATPLLQVNDLRAKIVESDIEILRGVNLTVNQGEVHAIMGKNGSGKSTFAKVLVGHPDYEVTGGSIEFKGENLLEMEPEERSLAGLFMSFQSPVEIPGVSNDEFLVMAYNARRKKLGLPELGPLECFSYLMEKLQLVNMKPDFLNRNVNEGFSGGERKRNEILQLAVLGADLAILDEIDSGLDVDALRDVANAVSRILTPSNSLLMITHYRRILDLLNPSHVHVMDKGIIARTGDISMVEAIETEGYETVSTLT